MASNKPQDFAAVLMPPALAAEVQRVSINVGQFTVNATKTTLAHIFDRAAVIREVWIAGDAIPSDPDGTMLVDVDVFDASEAQLDSIVNDFDAEAQLTVAKVAKQATIVAETAENERTVAAGDTLEIRLINNSAAITTNPNVVVTVLYQVLDAVTG